MQIYFSNELLQIWCCSASDWVLIMEMLTPTDQPCKTECVKFGYTMWFILIPPPTAHIEENSVNQRGWGLRG